MSTAQIYQIGMNIQTKKKPDGLGQAFNNSNYEGNEYEIKFSTTDYGRQFF